MLMGIIVIFLLFTFRRGSSHSHGREEDGGRGH